MPLVLFLNQWFFKDCRGLTFVWDRDRRSGLFTIRKGERRLGIDWGGTLVPLAQSFREIFFKIKLGFTDGDSF